MINIPFEDWEKWKGKEPQSFGLQSFINLLIEAQLHNSLEERLLHLLIVADRKDFEHRSQRIRLKIGYFPFIKYFHEYSLPLLYYYDFP